MDKLPMRRAGSPDANYRPSVLPRLAACDKRRQTGNESRFPPTDGVAACLRGALLARLPAPLLYSDACWFMMPSHEEVARLHF